MKKLTIKYKTAVTKRIYIKEFEIKNLDDVKKHLKKFKGKEIIKKIIE